MNGILTSETSVVSSVENSTITHQSKLSSLHLLPFILGIQLHHWIVCKTCASVSLPQPFFFCSSLPPPPSLSCSPLSSLHNTRKLTFCFYRGQTTDFPWAKQPRQGSLLAGIAVCQAGKVGRRLTFLQHCSSITNFSTAEFTIYQCTAGPDQPAGWGCLSFEYRVFVSLHICLF